MIKIVKRFLPHNFSEILETCYFRTIVLCKSLLFCLKRGISSNNINPYEIPIIINNFNRLSYVQQLTKALEKRGYSNIVILDNDSSYPPLLQYYKSCKYRVVYLKQNLGFKALWLSTVCDEFCSSYYVYTDPDLELPEDCPKDFMAYFLKLMKKYPTCMKVGFGLRIDDIPDTFIKKEDVLKQESKYWIKEVEKEVYAAEIDTTFALYRPYCKGPADSYNLMLRTGGKYIMRHLPWYKNADEVSAEDKYYLDHCKQPTHWSSKIQ